MNKLHTIVFLGKNAALVFREMNHGILEGKGLQLFGGYQDVDSSFSFFNSIFQIIKQVLDDCNSILLVSLKQSVCYIHCQCTIHEVSSKSLFICLRDVPFLRSRYFMNFYIFLS